MSACAGARRRGRGAAPWTRRIRPAAETPGEGLSLRQDAAEKRYMLRPPDEAQDVICSHRPRPGGPGGWVVRVGDATVGERESLAGAIDLTRSAALSHGRPAWLLDETGYPLKPMLPWNL